MGVAHLPRTFRLSDRQFVAFSLIAAALVCLSFTFSLYWHYFGDDLAFLAARDSYPGVLTWVTSRARTWSSRVGIEAALFVIPHYPAL